MGSYRGGNTYLASFGLDWWEPLYEKKNDEFKSDRYVDL